MSRITFLLSSLLSLFAISSCHQVITKDCDDPMVLYFFTNDTPFNCTITWNLWQSDRSNTMIIESGCQYVQVLPSKPITLTATDGKDCLEAAWMAHFSFNHTNNDLNIEYTFEYNQNATARNTDSFWKQLPQSYHSVVHTEEQFLQMDYFFLSDIIALAEEEKENKQ